MKKIKVVLYLLLLLSVGAAWYLLQPAPVVAPEISRYGAEWPLPHHDYCNSRSNPDSAINAANISNLQPLWHFALPIGASAGSISGNSIIQGDKIYCQDGQSNVYALDLDSGKLLWQKEYQLAASGSGGLSATRNRVYVSKGETQIAALDLKGREKWSVQLTDSPDVTIGSQPIEYDGLVYVATAAARSKDNSSPDGWGGIYALDYKNGEIRWSFSIGQEAMLKSNLPWSSGRFGLSPAIDTASGSIFWASDLVGPWPSTPDIHDKNAPARLYQQRIAAFNHLSGNMLWLQSLRNHDYLNLDLQEPPIIVSLDNRSIILAAGKGGRVYATEMGNGRPLWEVAVGEHQNDGLESPPRQTVQVLPGPWGGVASPMAYRDGVLYVPVVNQAGKYTPGKPESAGPDLSRSSGELLAIDVHYGKTLWRQTFDSAVLGGATLLGDLVFTSTYTGRIYAFNRTSGDKLWEYQTDAKISGWPAAAGKSIVFPLEQNGIGLVLAAFSVP